VKYLRSLSLRLGIVIVLLILQITVIVGVTAFVMLRFPLVSFVGYFISLLVFLFILQKNEASAYKMTWIIIILLVPSVGGVMYLMYGKEHRARRKVEAHVQEHALIAKLLDTDENLPTAQQVGCDRMYSLMQYVMTASSYHAYENTETKYYPFGELMFEDMLDEINKAEKFIFLEYFIIGKSGMWNRLLEALESKVAQGVEVRVIIDDIGSQKLFTNSYISQLRAKKIRVLRFNPLIPFLFVFMNNRDHRKILVVDGNAAFVGGLNIADEYINKNKRLGTWKDTGLRLKGDGVWSFTLMFIEMWDTFCKAEERINDHILYKQPRDTSLTTDGFILPYGDSPLDNNQLGENIYIDILNQAEKYVYIFTPYLIISEKMIHALQMAAMRGVEVKIVTPGIPDKKIVNRLTKSYYNSLLEAGVRIFEYEPGFLHAKSFVCDDKIAVVGTINLDYRSLYLHFECAALLYNSTCIVEMRDDALGAIGQSREVFLDERKAVRMVEVVFDAFLHLFAPLL